MRTTNIQAAALLALATADPAAVHDALRGALGSDEDAETRDDTDMHGWGLEHYAPRLALDDGTTPAVAATVRHDDYYVATVVIADYADGSTSIAVMETEHGFTSARRPSGDGFRHETIAHDPVAAW